MPYLADFDVAGLGLVHNKPLRECIPLWIQQLAISITQQWVEILVAGDGGAGERGPQVVPALHLGLRDAKLGWCHPRDAVDVSCWGAVFATWTRKKQPNCRLLGVVIDQVCGEDGSEN
jgi:hypothetical protein